jgi:hypothetical protein
MEASASSHMEAPMAVLVEEVLQVWREAERVLDRLPEATPERKLLQVEVFQLRSIHRRLTDTRIEQTAQLIASSRDTIGAARATLALARRRLEASGGR